MFILQHLQQLDSVCLYKSIPKSGPRSIETWLSNPGSSSIKLDRGLCASGPCCIEVYIEQSLTCGENTPHLSYMKTNIHCRQTVFTDQISLCSTRYAYWMGTRMGTRTCETSQLHYFPCLFSDLTANCCAVVVL